MAEEQNSLNDDLVDVWGRELTSWTLTKKTMRPERTFLWYVSFGLILLLLLVFSVWTQNFLFAILIVIFSFILVFDRYNPTPQVHIRIYDAGIAINDEFYPYSEFKAFRVMYEPPMKNLYLIRDTYINPFMKFPLEGQDPIALRDLLLQYLPEDLEKEGEYLSDKVQRWFKL